MIIDIYYVCRCLCIIVKCIFAIKIVKKKKSAVKTKGIVFSFYLYMMCVCASRYANKQSILPRFSLLFIFKSNKMCNKTVLLTQNKI